MMLRKGLTALVATSLVAGAAASAGAVDAVRQPAPMADSEGAIAGAAVGYIIAALVAAGIALVIIDDDNDDDDLAVSP